MQMQVAPAPLVGRLNKVLPSSEGRHSNHQTRVLFQPAEPAQRDVYRSLHFKRLQMTQKKFTVTWFTGSTTQVHPSDNLQKDTFEELVTGAGFTKPRIGYGKHDGYIVRGEIPNGTRKDANLPSGCLLIVDGDESTDNPKSAPPPADTHQILKQLNINHRIYTSHSHSKTLNRYRILIPCDLPNKDHLRPTVRKLFGLLHSAGSTLTCATANNTWSQAAYLGNRDTDDGLFECYGFFDGDDFTAEPAEVHSSGSSSEGEKFDSMQAIQNVLDASDYHSSLRDLAARYQRLGLPNDEIIQFLRGLMSASEEKGTERWQTRFDDIPRAVESAAKFITKTRIPLPPVISEETEPFPIHLLSDDMQRSAREIARFVKVHTDTACVSVLSAASSAIGRRVRVFERGGHDYPVALGFITMLQSGERKTPVFRLAFRGVYEAEKQLIEKWEKENTEALYANQMVDTAIKARQGELKKNPPVGKEAVIEQARLLAKLSEQRIKMPPKPSLIGADLTEEKLVMKLHAQESETIIASGEGRVVFDNIAGRYKQQGKTGEGVYLAATTNDPISYERANGDRDDIAVQDPCLNMMLFVQPDKVYSYLNNPIMAISGMTARLNLIAPPCMLGKRHEAVNEQGLNELELAPLENKIVALLSMRGTEGVELHLSPAAREARRLFLNEIEDRFAEDGDLRPYANETNKVVTQAMKFAAVITVFGTNTLLPSMEITEEACLAGIEFGRYFLRNQIFVIQHAREQDILKQAHDVVAWFRAKPERYNEYKENGFKTPGYLKQVIAPTLREHISESVGVLVEYKWIIREKDHYSLNF